MKRLTCAGLSLLLLAAGCCLSFAASPTAAARRKPNIIFIHADDLGYGDLGAYGQRKFKTPNIDQMAAEGMRFTDYYSGSTVCAPSRAVLLTGLHTGHVWVRGNGEFPLRDEDVTVAEVLKEAGYRTGVFGKWGLGLEDNSGRPDKQGFDESFGILHHVHAHRQYTDHLYRDGVKVGVDEKQYANDLFADAAIDFIRRNQSQPFFLYYALTVPHSELQVPEDSIAPFRGRFPEKPFVNPMGDAMKFPPYQQRSQRSQSHPNAAYAGMVTRIDGYVGRVLALLKELKLDEETIVFFTSDNGPEPGSGYDLSLFNSSGGLRGAKRDLYEGGIRVPMIVRWPGRVKAGQVSATVWAHWDFLPTAAELAGAKAPRGVDGLSFAPTLLGKGRQRQHEFLYWEFYERKTAQAVRMGDWKAVAVLFGGEIELYNLKSDPQESSNVAKLHPELAAKARAAMNAAHTPGPLWESKLPRTVSAAPR
jgi:arylsulfatase A